MRSICAPLQVPLRQTRHGKNSFCDVLSDLSCGRFLSNVCRDCRILSKSRMTCRREGRSKMLALCFRLSAGSDGFAVSPYQSSRSLLDVQEQSASSSSTEPDEAPVVRWDSARHRSNCSIRLCVAQCVETGHHTGGKGCPGEPAGFPRFTLATALQTRLDSRGDDGVFSEASLFQELSARSSKAQPDEVQPTPNITPPNCCVLTGHRAGAE